MFGIIMCQVWQEEEVAIAMVQFQLRCSIVIGVQIEISHKEALQVSLSLNTISYR